MYSTEWFAINPVEILFSHVYEQVTKAHFVAVLAEFNHPVRESMNSKLLIMKKNIADAVI